MTDPARRTIVTALRSALDETAGDEAEAAWLVWDRMKGDHALRDAFLEVLGPRIQETPLLIRQITQEALDLVGDEVWRVRRVLDERLDKTENPELARRVTDELAQLPRSPTTKRPIPAVAAP